MPFVVDDDTERLVRELADAMGTTLDVALRDAVRLRLTAVDSRGGSKDVDIADIQAYVKSLSSG